MDWDGWDDWPIYYERGWAFITGEAKAKIKGKRIWSYEERR